MRAKKYLILLVAIAVCVGVLWASEPPVPPVTVKEGKSTHLVLTPETQRDVLEGLQGVRVDVVVESSDPEGQKYVSKEQLQNNVELLLRKYGIRLISKDEDALAWTFAPTVVVRVHAMVVPQALCLFNTNVALKEVAVLHQQTSHRRHMVLADAWTWESSTIGYCELDWAKVNELIKKSVKDLVEIFINDYLAANPKQGLEESKGLDIPEWLAKQKIWVKCRNPQCGAEYQLSKIEYLEQIEELQVGERRMQGTPPLTCKECGEPSVYEAVKCAKCGLIFETGLKRGDYYDRCPKCGYSKIEHDRKKA